MLFVERVVLGETLETTTKDEMKLTHILVLSLTVVTASLARSDNALSADQRKFTTGSTVYVADTIG